MSTQTPNSTTENRRIDVDEEARSLRTHEGVQRANARTVEQHVDAADVEPRMQLPTSLSESEMKVFRSIEEHGLTPAEYAGTVDVSKSTVRTQLSRARRKVEEARQ